ncbi:MAG: DJ-1 family protein [Candidatus Muiribacterium halophilum]|uniref:DJ-1 family protein n=1 Tax=Muiribacterium halophilum TaxID=2053465 RepID=A0A2N5ZAM8_MUIH1|nr:MAG: DJ-1 family protein [Candidatus Muirbacterium halophilum]
MKNIVIVFSNRLFRDEELKKPYEYLSSKGYNIKLASDAMQEALGKLGMTIKPDMLAHNIEEKDFDAILFVGGPGTKVFFEDRVIHKIIRNFNEKGKLIGAICISPVILAFSGILSQKKATVWIDGKDTLEKFGATYTGNVVEIHNNIITANGPKAALDYAKEVDTYLSGT